MVSLLGAAILFHRFDKRQYEQERENGEASLVRALLEAHHVDRQLEEARRQRERQLKYEVLAEQVRAQTLARAREEGLLDPLTGGSNQGRASRDPPPYGTF